MATSEQKQIAVSELKAHLQKARAAYVDFRNKALAATHEAAQAEVARVLAEAKAEAKKPIDATTTALGVAAAAVAYVPYVGQLLAGLLAVLSALIQAAYRIGSMFPPRREPGPEIPLREGYETYRGFDCEAYWYLHGPPPDNGLSNLATFANLVHRRLDALGRMMDVDLLAAFPEHPKGTEIKAPYLFELPEADELRPEETQRVYVAPPPALPETAAAPPPETALAPQQAAGPLAGVLLFCLGALGLGLLLAVLLRKRPSAPAVVVPPVPPP